MVDPFRYIRLVGTVVLALGMAVPSSLWAQEQKKNAVRTAGTVANLFETLDPDESVDALRLTLPEAWTLEQVHVLRYGTEPVPVRVQRTDAPNTHLYVMGTSLEDPHDLVLRVQLPRTPGDFEWALQTLARNAEKANAEKADSTKRSRFRVVERRRYSLNVKPAPDPDQSNKAFSLTEAAEPLLLRADTLPVLGRASSFTIEFWMQTNGLDEPVLSTWNGDESVAYPAEFVVDRGGRLRYYTGQPGKHRALRTGRPVADGTWHHVAAIYDAQRSQLQLLLDGRRVDSLQGRLMTPSPGGIPLAIGGRLRSEGREEEASESLFSGRLDEVRIWGRARSVDKVRRMKSRPFQLTSEADRDKTLVRLSFDEDEPASVAQQWPEGARRVPVTLSFRSSLRNLRARTDDRTVTLEWTADPSGVQTFVVERSRGGSAFQTVAELTPAGAREASASDPPRFVYTDENVQGQVVFYRIRLKREDGVERTSGTIKIGLGPKADEKRAPVTLIGNFPNPFSKTTTVAYEVNESRPVTITVWDLQGHQIAELAAGMRSVGYHETPFDAEDLPSGTYFVKLETPSDTYTHRMVVLK